MTNLVINTIWLLNWQMDCCDEYGRFTSLDHWHVHHNVPPVDWDFSFSEPIPMCRTTLISKQTLHDLDPPTIPHRSQSLGEKVIMFVRKPNSFVSGGSQPILLGVAALCFPTSACGLVAYKLIGRRFINYFRQSNIVIARDISLDWLIIERSL